MRPCEQSQSVLHYQTSAPPRLILLPATFSVSPPLSHHVLKWKGDQLASQQVLEVSCQPSGPVTVTAILPVRSLGGAAPNVSE